MITDWGRDMSRKKIRLAAGWTPVVSWRLPGLLLVLALASPADAATSPVSTSSDSTIDAVAKDLADYRKRLTALQAQLKVSSFQPDEQLDRLDYDAAAIVDFVRDDVAFHPYAGVLRGPIGTLQSRSGNSLDQSLLLGYLLRTAGFDARIVRGELADADALRLLRLTKNATVAQSLDYLQAQVGEMTAGIPLGDRTAELTDSGFYEDTQVEAQRLISVLNKAGIDLSPSDVTDEYLSQVKSYFWVQHKQGPTSAWEDVHPAFGSAVPPVGLTPVESFGESIPAEHHHTLHVSASIEQWVNGKIVTHQIMKPWGGPVANLIGKPLRYSNVANGLTLDTAQDLDQALANTNLLIPNFNGGLAPGGKAFDLNGTLVDPMTLSGPGSAAFFQTLGNKAANAADGLAARKDGKPIRALHSMYLEFVSKAPSGTSVSQRRYILQPRSSYDNDIDALWELITDQTYVVTVGEMPVDYVADRTLSVSQQSLDWLEFIIRKTLEPTQGAVVPDATSPDVPPLIQSWSMNRLPSPEGVVRFRSVPGLVGIRDGYRDPDTRFTSVDVVFNRLEHVRVGDAGLVRIPKAALRQGVWDTVIESIPTRLRQDRARNVASTTQVFELARQQDIESLVITNENADLTKLGLNDQEVGRARADLMRAYTLVAPAEVPDGAVSAGWWRVNPTTGETLGMTSDGFGAESLEYTVLVSLLGNFKGLVDGVNAIKACETKPNMPSKLCCLMNAHADNVMGTSMGSIMGTLLGSGAATLWDAANTASQTATGQGLLPSVGPMNCDTVPQTDW